MLVIFLIILSLSAFLDSANAQEKKTFKSNFLDAEYFFLREEYEEAAYIYKDMLNADPFNSNLHFLIGACYLSIEGSKPKAIPHLEKAVNNVSASYREGSYRETNAPKAAFFALGKAYHINKHFDKAIEFYEKYKRVMKLSDVAEIEFVNKHISSVNLAAGFIRDTIDFDYYPISDNFNPSNENYRPLLAEKDSLLVFMTKKPFYTSVMTTSRKNGKWTKPVQINEQLEIEGKFKICCISNDGLELYLSIYKDSDWDLYVSYFQNNRWTPAENLGKEINTRYNETHASISADKKLMFFTSDKPGGLGALDIYSAERDKEGNWQKPVNLGKPVNGIYSEDTPFITNDGKTLYFSSMNHSTMGGFDIFYSVKLPTGAWSYPANLGYPLNTCDDDLFFVPLGKGENALYTSVEGELPKGKILAINLSSAKEEQKYTFKGKINAVDWFGLNTSTIVNIYDEKENTRIAEIIPDSGSFSVEISPGNYRLIIQSEGYESNVEYINILPQHKAKNIELETQLSPSSVVSGEYVLSRNLLFDFDSHKLSETSKLELEKLYRLLSDNPFLHVEVTGYTDALGSDIYNLNLAHKRSMEVINYLASKGIPTENFISKAAGKSGSIAENIRNDGSDNPEGRKFNRRVEINVINNSSQDVLQEDSMLPESLQPKISGKFYVILDESGDKNKKVPEKIADRDIGLYKSGEKSIYAAGIIPNRKDAIDFLNIVIDNDFPESRIITEKEFRYLLESFTPNIRSLKGPFTIQLLAVKNQLICNPLSFPEKIMQIRGKDRIYRYITGVFEDYAHALTVLPEYVSKGFTDAFINQLSKYLTYPIISDSAGTTEFYYTIQLIAVKNQVDCDYFKDIDNILIVKGTDDIYRYSTGMFFNIEQAEKSLKELKEKGYRNAFIQKSKSY